jgi:hypothetical protein
VRATSTNPSRGLSPTGGGSSSSQSQPKTQAAFVGKLYTILQDPEIAKARLLFWSDDGLSFVCPNPTEFAK